MSRKLRLPSPAMAVALAALFVALSGTAVAAGVPALAKRALTADKAKVADNAKKLEGKTSAQLLATANSAAKQAAESAASAAASQPGPASTAAGLVTNKGAGFSIGPDQEQFITATCDPGSKAVGGGFNNPTAALVLSFGSYPTADGAGWTEDLVNIGSSTGSGNVVAMCLK